MAPQSGALRRKTHQLLYQLFIEAQFSGRIETPGFKAAQRVSIGSGTEEQCIAVAVTQVQN